MESKKTDRRLISPYVTIDCNPNYMHICAFVHIAIFTKEKCQVESAGMGLRIKDKAKLFE